MSYFAEPLVRTFDKLHKNPDKNKMVCHSNKLLSECKYNLIMVGNT